MKTSIIFILFVLLVFYFQQSYCEKKLANAKLLQAAVDNIQISNLFLGKEKGENVSNVFKYLALKDIISFGNKKSINYNFIALDIYQRNTLCSGYNRSLKNKYLQTFDNYYQENNSDFNATKTHLLVGLEIIDSICTHPLQK